MRPDSKELDYNRTKKYSLNEYPIIHERHRIFPEIFENRKHDKILDVSAGIGYFAKKIKETYDCDLTCNEVDPHCLEQLKALDVTITSMDLDTGKPLPIEDKSYDAILCLATLEHLLYIDEFTQDLHRILKDDGTLYFSVPNYASLFQMLRLLKGKTFHDPFDERSRYEFYAHIRYFTHQTIVEYMDNFGFSIDTVYLPIPKSSTRFLQIKDEHPIAAFGIQQFFKMLYMISPRWHQEPIITFVKKGNGTKPRTVIL